MPRRQQRRPAFRPPRGQSRGRGDDQAGIDAGARRLLAGHDESSLKGLVHDLRMLRDEADLAATNYPSSEALGRYRRAARELAEAERALTLMGVTD